VLPLRPGRVDRPAAAVAMALAPAVGLCLGGLAGAVGAGTRALGAPAVLAGALAVTLVALLTRGLHLDGLADSADGLGSYRDAGGALEIMKRPEVGPFGVVAIALVLLVQATSLSGVLVRSWPVAVLGTAVATGTGRLAATWACRRGVPAARPDGLGALVAGSVAWPVPLAGSLAVAALSLAAVPDHRWQGPLSVLFGLAAPAVLVRHAVRRLGGVTGDVLGAAIEVGSTVALAVLAV
jgi:adenosylcobinamide-GDP ribazoletransferase